MTKEELEKEAEKWLREYLLCYNCEKKCNRTDSNSYCEEQVLKSYLAGAEPREKRITDLEKENAELKETVTKMNNVITEIFRNLSKAKVVLRNVIDYLGQFCSDYPDCVIEAEQFLKDCEVEK
jgi:uncharacterized coiled-coil protein SlyX